MRLIDAMSFRDGGTTTITLKTGFFRKVSYTIDFSLPHDGRPRFIFRGKPYTPKKDMQRLDIGSAEEVRIQNWLSEAAVRQFGQPAVQDFLEGRSQNPGRGKWGYALNFLNILTKERRAPSGGAKAGS